MTRIVGNILDISNVLNLDGVRCKPNICYSKNPNIEYPCNHQSISKFVFIPKKEKVYMISIFQLKPRPAG